MNLLKRFQKLPPVQRPEKWKGRVWNAQRRGWWFVDTHDGFIPEECREDELEQLETLQVDNMKTAYKLFNPEKDWPR